MAFWKDKEGKEVSAKQFAARWWDGIERISPVQQLRLILLAYFIILVGLIAGISYAVSSKLWWLAAVLAGTLILQFFGAIGTLQKIRIFKKQEEMQKQILSEKNTSYVQ